MTSVADGDQRLPAPVGREPRRARGQGVSPQRGSWLSLLGWLAPVALIVGGLAFLAADVTDRGSGPGGATPSNAAAAARTHGSAFVTARAPQGAGAELVEILPVSATPDGPALYHLRLVVVSHETLPDASRTVAFCVRWDVDTSTGGVTEVGSVELSTDRGLQPTEPRRSDWRSRCASEQAI